MKKIIYCTLIACLIFSAVSCKSTKVKKGKDKAKEAETSLQTEAVSEEKPEAGEAGETGVAGAGEEGTETSAGKPENPAIADGGNSAANGETSDSSTDQAESKDFTGWIKGSKKNITERFGNIQIKIKSGIGSYTLSVLNDKEKPLPVLSTKNEYVTNAFFIKNSKKTYNLVTDSSVRTSAKRTKDGASILYEVPSVAQVTVNFSCFSSEKDKENDMIKVTATIKNISSRNDDFSLKAILDTVLGEAANFHFYTYEDIPVKNEVLYRTLQNQKWFVSKNINAAMQLFFAGADATSPELLALANYSTLEKNSWEPDMLNYRVFDTVLSYNDSAVCAIWKPLKLAPSESGKIVFYLALSGNGTPATGEKFIYSKEFAPAEEKTEDSNAKSSSGLKIITPYSSEEDADAVAVPAQVTDFINEPDAALESPVKGPAEVPNVDFYIKNMTKEHLTPEYIQSLLDRIAALEEDSPSLNRQELLQLNTELDAILTYLRQH